MKSERDLIAEWAGEELYAAVRAPQDARATHSARSEFYLAILRGGLDDRGWQSAAADGGAYPRYL